MNNKEAIETIKVIQDFYKTYEFTCVPLSEKDNQALDKAIASLEDWDKVKKELEEVYNDRPSSYNHSQRTELFCGVMKIIDRYAESEEVE